MGIISCANAMDERLIALPSQPQKFILVEGIDIVSNDLMAILNSIDVSPIISSLLIDGL